MPPDLPTPSTGPRAASTWEVIRGPIRATAMTVVQPPSGRKMSAAFTRQSPWFETIAHQPSPWPATHCSRGSRNRRVNVVRRQTAVWTTRIAPTPLTHCGVRSQSGEVRRSSAVRPYQPWSDSLGVVQPLLDDRSLRSLPLRSSRSATCSAGDRHCPVRPRLGRRRRRGRLRASQTADVFRLDERLEVNSGWPVPLSHRGPCGVPA